MCRIAGVFYFKENISLEDHNSIKKASEKLKAGGPDHEGIYSIRNLILLHRRLSIIDTTDAGNQPFLSDDSNYSLSFNGEIFNYQELKDSKLSHLNISFKSNSDTEVLMHLLINYGTECLNWLSGFFAFAFYNLNTNELIIGRDRFGKKPLLYYKNSDKIIFASELKAILCFDIQKEIDFDALQTYFELSYIPQNTCILKNVVKIQPGSFVRISQNEISTETYYKTRISSESYNKYNYSSAQTTLIKLLSKSVEERMISDVELGAFLSGGIDSSVVVALASQYTAKLKTYSIGYKNNPIFDETKYAHLVAKKFKTDHHVFYLEEKDYMEVIFEILDYLDEPFADSSTIPQYILCKQTKNNVTVALSGDGGDEIFAGYNKHQAEWQIRNKPILGLLATVSKPLSKILPNHKDSKLGNLNRKLQKFEQGYSLSAKERYIKWCSQLYENKEKSLLIHNDKKSDKYLSHYKTFIDSNDLNSVLLADINLVLPSDMLFKVDMMSMANSLEVRSPFLDYKIVDFAFELPDTYKVNGNLKKRIVQDAFRNLLPSELYNRPKQGFDIPLINWFRTDLKSFIFDDLLNTDYILEQGIFSVDRINELKTQLFSKNNGNVAETIWALVVFQHWYRKYFVS